MLYKLANQRFFPGKDDVRNRGLHPYCERSGCKWWSKCSLSLDDKTKTGIIEMFPGNEIAINNNRSCYTE